MILDQDDFAASLQGAIGYFFSNPALLQEALTHKSFTNEASGSLQSHNERLEFLGDAVLDLVVSELAFQRYPELPEGQLTRIRSELVSEKALAEVARSLALGAALRLGRGEHRSGGRQKDSLLANALEALFGAVLRDGGYLKAREVVEPLFAQALERSAQSRSGNDYKTRLQERLQAHQGQLPEYVMREADGPDHDRCYLVDVLCLGQVLGSGRGRSKKGAEQEAAREALSRLEG